jgi:hypothetical protein
LAIFSCLIYGITLDFYHSCSEAPDRRQATKKEGRLTLAPELPQDGVLEAGEGLFITLSRIEINEKPGVSDLEIIEETGETTTGRMTIQSF